MTGPTDEFDEPDTPDENIDRVIDEGQPVQFDDRPPHAGCVHGPDVTHSPNMRLRLTTW
jgi:hypothetical protein